MIVNSSVAPRRPDIFGWIWVALGATAMFIEWSQVEQSYIPRDTTLLIQSASWVVSAAFINFFIMRDQKQRSIEQNEELTETTEK